MQIIYKVTMDRARPPRPEDVPDAIWNLVEWCWRHYPETRPEFKKIVEELTPLV